MAAGPKGEGGLDDATGASGAAGGAGLKQTSATVDLGTPRSPWCSPWCLCFCLEAFWQNISWLGMLMDILYILSDTAAV